MRITTNSSGWGRHRKAFLGFQWHRTCFQPWGVRKYWKQAKSDWGWTFGYWGVTFFLWDFCLWGRLARDISRFSVGWWLAKLHRGGKRLIQLRQLANPCKYPRQKIALTAYLQISYFNKNAPEIVALALEGFAQKRQNHC
jgi:hypothetical protein